MNELATAGKNKLVELEALRGAAAIYVFIHHAHLMANQGIGRLLYFGQEAVIVFFLLSGFVISYSSNRQHPTWPTYIFHRAKRIYPIFIAALALAYGSQSIIKGNWLDLNTVQLIGNTLMLQDVASLKRGVWFDTYYGNSPMWSLSYEWWFYILFIPLGLNKTAFTHNRALVGALMISIIGFIGYQINPNQLCLFAGYFFIWWTGVEFSKEYCIRKRLSFSGQKATLFGLLLMASLWCAPVIIRLMRNGDIQLGIDPFLQFRHHAAALIFSIIGIYFSQKEIKIYRFILKPFVYLAPISYAIYLIHQPLLDVINNVGGNFPAWLTALMAFPIILLLGWLLEVKMQNLVNHVFDKSNWPLFKFYNAD